MKSNFEVIVVGGGIFGVTAAVELASRGYRVALLDSAQPPNPLAASTDISKVVRIEYGGDDTLSKLADIARQGWCRWNDEFKTKLYHEVGLIMLTRLPMKPGEYEYENYRSLLKRGYHPERLDSTEISKRFPAFRAGLYTDGYFHDKGGYVESGKVVSALAEKAKRSGVKILPKHTVTRVAISSGQVGGVEIANGDVLESERVLIAAGAWTPYLFGELKPSMRTVGMPVFHLKPSDPALFQPPSFAVFSADVTHSGWYGFPFHAGEGVVKIAYHGLGEQIHPTEDKRVVTDHEIKRLREFLAECVPVLAEAPIVYTRRCLYCDTLDENFWIDCHPKIDGLCVASGGSGHAFKFAPLLGQWAADALERKPNPDLARFRWRELVNGAGTEASRHRQTL